MAVSEGESQGIVMTNKLEQTRLHYGRDGISMYLEQP
jgi:hypothetical protein